MKILNKRSTVNNSFLKTITALLFIALPFLGFMLGMKYYASVTEPTTLVRKPTTPQVSNPPYPTLRVDQNELAGWKTYTFQPLQLSLKVPSELTVHTEEPNPGNDFTAYIQNYPFNAPVPSENAYQLYIIWQKTLTITQSEFQQLKNDLVTNSVEDTTIAGYQTVKGQVKGERNRYVAYILKGSTKISLFTSEPTQVNKERTDQILSTFKFLDQNQTGGTSN